MGSNRRRLGVAVLLDPPVSDEVDGLRRALGDPALGRIAAHVTLVPPVNVKTVDFRAVLARLRAAAAVLDGPIRLTVGAPATFLPANPVLYLSVGGDLDGLRSLRDAVSGPPLDRPLSWPWVPHVTLADGAPPEIIEAGLTALAGYTAVVEVDRVVLLEEGRSEPDQSNPAGGRVWRPLADATLGRLARVGTGGLELELTAGRLPDPELVELAFAAGAGLPASLPEALEPPVVLTARRAGQPVGAATAWVDRSGSAAALYVLPAERGQGIGRHLYVHLQHRAALAGWDIAWPTGEGAGP